MIEPRHRDRFLKEALFDLLIAGVLFMKLFDCDDATGGVGVFGLEDRAEPAAPNVIGDLVSANASAAHSHSEIDAYG